MTDGYSAVHRLYVSYVDAVDGAIDEWPDLFVADGTYRLVARENWEAGLPLAAVRCDSQAMMRDRVDAITTTAYWAPRRVRHVIGLLDVRGTGPDGWSVSTTFAAFESVVGEATRVLAAGTYHDRVVTGDGGLRFAEKVTVYDGDLVEGSLVFPL